jgi:hypothetical protein
MHRSWQLTLPATIETDLTTRPWVVGHFEKVSPAMAAGVTDRLWEMVDIVDVLDAFEAKRKREPKVAFDVERWRLGEGFYVTVTEPGNEPKQITETFQTEDEARYSLGVLKINLPIRHISN